ncbi:MAG TPA: hypothetical protein VFA23_17385 [Dongiaceae bacterium]|nr:hypothetical protein [Dongiaceae bacterium]
MTSLALSLLIAAVTLAGCLNSDGQYQRPRSMDTPSIYSDSPVPKGRLNDN